MWIWYISAQGGLKCMRSTEITTWALPNPKKMTKNSANTSTSTHSLRHRCGFLLDDHSWQSSPFLPHLLPARGALLWPNRARRMISPHGDKEEHREPTQQTAERRCIPSQREAQGHKHARSQDTRPLDVAAAAIYTTGNQLRRTPPSTVRFKAKWGDVRSP